MTDYTPTTADVEDAWCSRWDGEHSWASGEELRGYEAEFDRWLKQVKAEAWDEGRAAGWAEDCAYDAPNPYRQETDR